MKKELFILLLYFILAFARVELKDIAQPLSIVRSVEELIPDWESYSRFPHLAKNLLTY